MLSMVTSQVFIVIYSTIVILSRDLSVHHCAVATDTFAQNL